MVLFVAGLVQGWYTRHSVFGDGVYYLDIARYYAQGNWHAALNSYWSPLYSWILAFWMLLLRPSSYWETSLLQVTNFVAYLACLVGFERFLTRLLNLQRRVTNGMGGVSEWTVRIIGYSVFSLSTLLLIGVGQVSPDMVGTAIALFLAAILLDIEAGNASSSTYIWFGILLAFEYLARGAFLNFIPLYLAIAAILIYRRNRRWALRPILVSAIVAFAAASPFVIALSLAKGRFTLGDARNPNYGWEVDGAARFIHWQGEPGDIGKPLHPTHKVFGHPAVYTFASPVPGLYPPWYDPSYWYAGISPRLKVQPQLYVLKRGLDAALYLFLRSPVVLPAFFLIFFMGWRRWLSSRGVLAYWFLLLPSFAYIVMYTLVFIDSRYVAGSLLVVWMCILASISLEKASLRARANQAFQALAFLFAVWFLGRGLYHPVLYTVDDLFHLRESEWNLNWMVAERMKQVGLRPGDRIAWIGKAMDAEWVGLDGAKIVAEVPVRWDRLEDTRFRYAAGNRAEIKAFWYAPPAVKDQVFDLFRKEGATFVMIDRIPNGVDSTGWHRLLPEGTPHLPWNGGQSDDFVSIAYKRLAPTPSKF